jgi:hypothetical protein
LSTSQTLANALGGYLIVNPVAELGNQGTTVEFGIATSKTDSAEKFITDIKILKENSLSSNELCSNLSSS